MTPDPEQAAQRIAEALNGGEWRDGRWYTEGQRQAWIAAVTPVIAEFEREIDALHEAAAGASV